MAVTCKRICSSRHDLQHAQLIMTNEQICKLHDKLHFSAGSFSSVLISSSVPRLSPLALLLLKYSLPLSPPHRSRFSSSVALVADLFRLQSEIHRILPSLFTQGFITNSNRQTDQLLMNERFFLSHLGPMGHLLAVLSPDSTGHVHTS